LSQCRNAFFVEPLYRDVAQIIQPLSSSISVAFETAAGAFAVVGVGDVLVRSGVQIYNFLHDVADAPKEIESMRESLKDVMLLYHTAKQYQADLTPRTLTAAPDRAAALLASATKRLNREVQSLRVVMSKFKGSKTWSRVKYVLNEAKVNKKCRASLKPTNFSTVL